MTKQEIAQKHGFIQGMSIHSNTAKIEECLYAAMEEYVQQQVKLFAIPVVSESTLPTEKEIIDIILDEVFIRGIDLEDYRLYFQEPRASIKKRLDELYSR